MTLSIRRLIRNSNFISCPACFVFLILVFSVPLAGSGQSTILKVNVPQANVRMEPDIESGVITRLKLGELLEARTRLGDWFEIGVTDSSGNVVTGYIRSSFVEVLASPKDKAPETQPPVSPPQRVPTDLTPREAEKVPYPGTSAGGMTGIFLKFGVIDKGWGDWLGSLGYDRRIYKNFSLGLEVMPSYYSVENEISQLKLTSIPINVFLNIKGATRLGGIRPEMEFITLFGGIGGGVFADRSEATFENVKSDLVTTYGAMHFLGGFELQARKTALIFEYQLIRILDPSSSKNPWIGYLIFGIRL